MIRLQLSSINNEKPRPNAAKFAITPLISLYRYIVLLYKGVFSLEQRASLKGSRTFSGAVNAVALKLKLGHEIEPFHGFGWLSILVGG